MRIFDFLDYKEFVSQMIARHREQRGYRSQLASAAGCQLSFLSQVVHGPVHFTPEHALGVAFFWGLQPLERAYFVELVNFARAGTPELRAFLQHRLEELVAAEGELSSRFDAVDISPDEGARRYYSIWYYSAIHILCSIPDYQEVAKIAQRLELGNEVVHGALLFLESMALVKQERGRWKIATPFVHMPKGSWLNYFNHFNWHHRALANAVIIDNEDTVHYSAVCSVARADIAKLRELTLAFLDAHRQVCVDSPPEELVAITCDFFKV